MHALLGISVSLPDLPFCCASPAGEVQETVEGRGAGQAALHGVKKGGTRLSNGTATTLWRPCPLCAPSILQHSEFLQSAKEPGVSRRVHSEKYRSAQRPTWRAGTRPTAWRHLGPCPAAVGDDVLTSESRDPLLQQAAQPPRVLVPLLPALVQQEGGRGCACTLPGRGSASRLVGRKPVCLLSKEASKQREAAGMWATEPSRPHKHRRFIHRSPVGVQPQQTHAPFPSRSRPWTWPPCGHPRPGEVWP